MLVRSPQVYRGSWQGHVVAIKILVACHVEDIKTTEQAQAALTLPVPTLAKLRAVRGAVH